jgi:hypothetical protein
VTDKQMPAPLPYADVRARAAEAAARTERSDPVTRAYVDQIRVEVARLAPPAANADDVRAAVALLEEQAHLDAVAPLESANRAATAAKRVVRKAVFFTTHHLAAQISSLGWSTVWLGNATADQLDRIERRLDAIEARLDRLEDAVPRERDDTSAQ